MVAGYRVRGLDFHGEPCVKQFDHLAEILVEGLLICRCASERRFALARRFC